MSFISASYYLFLFLTAVIYYLIKPQYRSWVLLIASYAFYISYDYRFIYFILATTLVSYQISLYMSKTENQVYRRWALYLGLGIEFCFLFFTKYFTIILESLDFRNPIHILVPLGISFYTFQTMGYLFDVYRRQIQPEKNYIRYSLFLSFFPHLLAGPIESAQNFLPQIQNASVFQRKNIFLGITLIMIGLFKKLVIADRVSHIVNLVFSSPEQYHGSAVGLAVFLARYQIYCDFSGYTDIALGSAQILGFKMTENFNRPFFSRSITEYWQRWHISLAQWIRRYIFYPLVSTPVARFGVHGLILITFLVLGLWHGGTVNFLIYGIWQGLFVILDSSTKNLRHQFYSRIGIDRYPKTLNAVAMLGTFFLIVVPPTLFFRATDFATSQILIQNVFQGWSLSDLTSLLQSEFIVYSLKIGLSCIVLLEFMSWLSAKYELRVKLFEKSEWTMILFWLLLAAFIFIFGYFETSSKFIYMRF